MLSVSVKSNQMIKLNKKLTVCITIKHGKIINQLTYDIIWQKYPSPLYDHWIQESGLDLICHEDNFDYSYRVVVTCYVHNLLWTNKVTPSCVLFWNSHYFFGWGNCQIWHGLLFMSIADKRKLFKFGSSPNQRSSENSKTSRVHGHPEEINFKFNKNY